MLSVSVSVISLERLFQFGSYVYTIVIQYASCLSKTFIPGNNYPPFLRHDDTIVHEVTQGLTCVFNGYIYSIQILCCPYDTSCVNMNTIDTTKCVDSTSETDNLCVVNHIH